MHNIGFRRCSKNEVLFGHDVTMGLLAFESDGHGQIKIFARDGSSTRAETAPFQPFMLLAGDALSGWQGDATLENLDGRGAFNRLAFFPTSRSFKTLSSICKENPAKGRPRQMSPIGIPAIPYINFSYSAGRRTFGNDLSRLEAPANRHCNLLPGRFHLSQRGA